MIQHQWQAGQQYAGGDPHDRPEAQHAGLVDGLVRLESLPAIRLQREVDQHDAVLPGDADQLRSLSSSNDLALISAPIIKIAIY